MQGLRWDSRNESGCGDFAERLVIKWSDGWGRSLMLRLFRNDPEEFNKLAGTISV